MGKINILVVEDEPIIGLTIRKRLENIGLNVIMVVSSGDEAYQISSERVPDLILMDIQLEGELNGLDTARILWNNFSVPIVIVTGSIEFQSSQDITEDWCYGFILKPFQDLELESVVSKTIIRIFQEKFPQSSESFQNTYNPFQIWLQNSPEHSIATQLLSTEFISKNIDRYLAMDVYKLFSNQEFNELNLNSVNAKDYLTHLIFIMWYRYNPNNSKNIQLNLESEPVILKESLAIPVGIILIEAFKNSLQYAYPKEDSRFNRNIDINFGISKSGSKFFFKIRDYGIGLSCEGVGYPNSSDTSHKEIRPGIGLKIIQGMIELLNSEFYFSGDQGTCLEIFFPLDNNTSDTKTITDS